MIVLGGAIRLLFSFVPDRVGRHLNKKGDKYDKR